MAALTPVPSSSPSIPRSSTAAAQANLVSIVHANLKNQHRWTNLRIHTSSLSIRSPSISSVRSIFSTSSSKTTRFFPRPVITGLPPTRIYVSPDEDPANLPTEPEEEWVLPVDLREKWSVSRMAGVFDAIPEVTDEERMDRTLGDGDADDTSSTKSRERIPRTKRVLMAVVAEDSTVVYYLVHEGVVKPRQN